MQRILTGEFRQLGPHYLADGPISSFFFFLQSWLRGLSQEWGPHCVRSCINAEQKDNPEHKRSLYIFPLLLCHCQTSCCFTADLPSRCMPKLWTASRAPTFGVVFIWHCAWTFKLFPRFQQLLLEMHGTQVQAWELPLLWALNTINVSRLNISPVVSIQLQWQGQQGKELKITSITHLWSFTDTSEHAWSYHRQNFAFNLTHGVKRLYRLHQWLSTVVTLDRIWPLIDRSTGIAWVWLEE